MRLSVSGKFSNEVFDDAHHILSFLKEAILKSKLDNITTAIKSFVYFPVIVSDDIGIRKKSYRSYSRKEEAEFVNVEIPYGRWMVADRNTKLLLLTDGLRIALMETDTSKIDESTKEIILTRIKALENTFIRA